MILLRAIHCSPLGWLTRRLLWSTAVQHWYRPTAAQLLENPQSLLMFTDNQIGIWRAIDPNHLWTGEEYPTIHEAEAQSGTGQSYHYASDWSSPHPMGWLWAMKAYSGNIPSNRQSPDFGREWEPVRKIIPVKAAYKNTDGMPAKRQLFDLRFSSSRWDSSDYTSQQVTSHRVSPGLGSSVARPGF
ncbi:predicted protein [Aspergillus nidulans FGSC A4]|uniref:Uncharacterized protein n=1 Tax=Emericella nidulans (strain FGSC A4 / ATCC 38163 / CBS 112.46 / NRRL 194 / M139) TaxID=227321 RepID=Q5B555_EMENI|nr:hypothetical protein [Aspergillus nidulans FGSC A4]EAA60486.1 predicted protein [Aspergillus nidulans FGSC A4]CBF77760.1 TPA: hypothetical protein ANIA_04325 [Aspergillus nidulans FGSC A4]|eukprot:XP_661929.1 predicted protein [Aspergillus nidulans FGSC A4]